MKVIKTSLSSSLPIDELPKQVDWVKQGAVTKVKDQGMCGSCWSFAAIGALEGAYYLKYHHLQYFSEQQLVDCDTSDAGCDGGEMSNAFDWIQQHGTVYYIHFIDASGGICLEDDYPYVSGESQSSGQCTTTCSPVPHSILKSYTEVEPSCDACLVAAIAKQPVAVAIEADHREFQLYKSGVFTAKCGAKLDHGVLAVGYGETKEGLKYYKVLSNEQYFPHI